jgi:hypothetical protein
MTRAGEPVASEPGRRKPISHHRADLGQSALSITTYCDKKYTCEVDASQAEFSGHEVNMSLEEDSISAQPRKDGNNVSDSLPQGVDLFFLIEAQSALDTAKAALKIGLRPVPLHAIGHQMQTQNGIKIAIGKEPTGSAWGKKIWTEASIERVYKEVPGRGVGLLLGPEGRVIDIEIDRPKDCDPDEFEAVADLELAKLCGGEIPSTAGWSSHKGKHRLFLWDDRLADCDESGKGNFKLGLLEIRLGAKKQTQSAVPPTLHQEGYREWDREVTVVGRLPDVAIEAIVAEGSRKRKEAEAKRLIGLATNEAKKIIAADKGDSNTGRHPTALIASRSMAGLVEGHGRQDLTAQIQKILIDAYRESKPELNPDDAEFLSCIKDGWSNGAAEGFTMDDRPQPDSVATLVPKPSGTDQKNINGQLHASAAAGATATADPKTEPVFHGRLGKAATLATFRALSASREFIWPYFIAKRALNLIDGIPGSGKSRFVLDLLRRVRAGDAWPDGQPMFEPDNSRWLWIAADSNYDQLIETATEFGIEDEAFAFPGDEENPYDFTDLTDPRTLDVIDQRIVEEGVSLVVIDTATNACGDTQQMDRAEIGKIAKSLALMANRHNVAILLIGHQNAKGGSYGDAWPGNVDCRMKMEADLATVRIEVVKSRWNKMKAPLLEGTQRDDGWTFKVEPRDIEATAGTAAAGTSSTDHAKTAVLEYVGRYPEMKKSEVIKRVIDIAGVGRSSIYTAISELVRDGEIISVEKDNGHFKAQVLVSRFNEDCEDDQKKSSRPIF